MHRRAAGIKGNLDDRRGGHLPADADDVLDRTQVVGPRAAAVPSRQCAPARPGRGRAVAGPARPWLAGRVARRCVVGAASGAGRVSGLDHRDEEHAIGFVLPVIDSFLPEMAGDGPRRTEELERKLRTDLALRGDGDGEQIVDRPAAGGPLPVRVVARRPVALAQRGGGGSPLRDVACGRRRVDVDAGAANAGRERSAADADRAGAAGAGGRQRLVLPR